MKKRENANYKYLKQQPPEDKKSFLSLAKEKLLWFGTQTGLFALRLAVLVAAYFLVEVFALLLVKPTEYTCLLFGADKFLIPAMLVIGLILCLLKEEKNDE